MRTHVIPLLLLAACAAVHGAPTAEFGGEVRFEAAREYVHPRVEEDGYRFTFALDVHECQGREVKLTAYAQGTRFLGDVTVVPPYDGTHWDTVRLFVPLSRLAGLASPFAYTIYALSPDDSGAYIGTFEVASSHLGTPEAAWDWKSFTEDASLPSGREGVETNLSLQLVGHQGETPEAVLAARDPEGNELLRLPLTLKVPYESSLFPEMTFRLPYEELSHLPPAQEVVLTPTVRLGDRVVEGNLHIHLWAGGSLTRLQGLYGDEARKLDEKIDRLQRQLEALDGKEK